MHERNHEQPGSGSFAVHIVATAALVACPIALAQPVPQPAVRHIDTVVVTATRIEQEAFDLPVAIDAVGPEDIRRGQLQVNLSESLVRVPGLVIQNRHNYAQDLQISSRGFGARAQFGVRGIRLFQDGIPATMPDGQGQSGSFSLTSARSIEVLRGPFSTLYGNAAGGVIQVFTEDGPPVPTVTASGFAGSFGSWRAGAKVAGAVADLNYVVDGGRFETDGYREHSAARRDQSNTKLRIATPADGRLTLVANTLDQPETQDPLGLTRAQWIADPRQVDPAALRFDTRKSTRQQQLGIVHEQPIGSGHTLRLSLYGGTREIEQYLALPGTGETSSGGVTDLDRDYAGVGLRWTWDGQVAGGHATLSVGADGEALDEGRRGYVNAEGVKGPLRRDERNEVANRDFYAQAEWGFLPSWSALAGIRTSRVEFDSKDDYVTAANPDDSGRRTFSSTNPVVGLVWHASDTLNVYANYGRGFETPTFIELAYRRDGTGLNFELGAARSTHYEVGTKWRPSRAQRIDLALFRVDTRDEIVVDAATGGRTTYKNAPSTRRNGAEFAWNADWGTGLRTTLAGTLVDARYRDAFVSGGSLVAAGNRMPGIPLRSAYAEVAWQTPWRAILVADVRYASRVFVDDRNSDAAPGYTIANLRAIVPWRIGAWSLEAFARVDNVAGRKYVGSVIVGDTNGRFFEPAPERSFFVGVSAQYALPRP